jgi:hypothetical protein
MNGWDWVPGTMIVIVIIAIIAVIVMGGQVGCSDNLVEQPEAVVKPPHTITSLAGDAFITIYEIDGCQYASKGDCLIHLETCPNEMHHK